MAGLMVAQTATPAAPSPSLPNFNPPPCDFNNTFYADNGIDSSNSSELNAEPDGRFGSFRQTGPPATGSQQNWVNDSTCPTNDPVRRNVRILATTGGNSDDGNSPFSCFDQAPSPGSKGAGQFGQFAAFPQCTQQPGANPPGQRPETAEFISILAFLHNQAVFESSYTRNVGFINGGLEGVQQNPGENISLVPGTDNGGNSTGLNPRHDDNNPPQSGISMQYIVSNFEAYASINQTANTLRCPNGATMASQCSPAPGNFAAQPCSVQMINNLGVNPPVATLPTFCFNVADTQDSSGNTISDVATPKLRQNWRFATNRNAMDGSDNNCINDANCGNPGVDAPFGYFCDDLLGMWIITYFWFTAPPNDMECGPTYKAMGNANGFTPDGFPIILTAHELNDELEGHLLSDGVTPHPCGSEGQEDPGGTDNGAAWLVCPALPDPRNGAITSDAFLDAVTTAPNTFVDQYIFNTFVCLQKKGKFCDESSTISQ
jgi:hypothetical protein